MGFLPAHPVPVFLAGKLEKAMDNPWLMCGTQEILLPGDDRARQSHSPAVSKQGQESSALPLTKLSFDLRGQARFAHCSKMPGRLPLLAEALGRLGLLSWQLSWEFPLGAGLSQVQPAQGRGSEQVWGRTGAQAPELLGFDGPYWTHFC